MQPNSNISPKNGVLLALILSVLFALFYLILMPATMLWDRDEALYARTSVEMLQSGNWIIPTYNGGLFPHKPPMLFWLMAISIDTFGNNEFGARFVSGPMLGITSFLTFLMGRRMFNHHVGIWALVIVATSSLSVYLGTTAMHDSVLTTCICVSAYAYIEIVYSPKRFALMVIVFSTAMYCCLMIKGPVGPAVVITMVLTSWLLMTPDNRPSFARMVVLAIGALFAFGVFLLWVIPINEATDGALLREGFGRHVIERALVPMENHGGNGVLGFLVFLPFYIPITLVGFMPWTIHLPAAFKALYAGTLGTRRERAILWGWIVPTFVMFTLAATKLPHYIFPMFPALAIASAAMVIEGKRKNSPLPRVGAYLYATLSFGLAILILLIPVFENNFSYFVVFGPASIFVALTTFVVFRKHKAGHSLAASKILGFVTPIVLTFILWVAIPLSEPHYKISHRIAQAIQKSGHSKNNIYRLGYSEPSLVFYVNPPVNHPIRVLPHDDAGIMHMLAKPDQFLFLLKREKYDQLVVLAKDNPLEIIEEFAAYNSNKGGDFQTMILAGRPKLK